jgi:hypothetical protein
MQKFLLPSVQRKVTPKFRQRNSFLALESHANSEEAIELPDTNFYVTPPLVVGKKRKARMSKSAHATALVDSVYRRSTRSCTKRDGHKPVSMSDTVSRPRKKSKLQKQALGKEGEVQVQATVSTDADDSSVAIPPETPLHVMKSVGIALGIEPTLLTEEKLKAAPKGKKKKNPSNDK